MEGNLCFVTLHLDTAKKYRIQAQLLLKKIWMFPVLCTLLMSCSATAVVTHRHLKLFTPRCLQRSVWGQIQQHTYITWLLQDLQLVFVQVNSAKNSLVGVLMCSRDSVWPSEEAPADAVGQQWEDFGEEASPHHTGLEETAKQAGEPWEPWLLWLRAVMHPRGHGPGDSWVSIGWLWSKEFGGTPLIKNPAGSQFGELSS